MWHFALSHVPWPTPAVSVATASAFVATISALQKRAEGIRSIRQSLTDTVGKLIAANLEFDKSNQAKMDAVRCEGLRIDDFQPFSYLNDQRLTLAKQAAFLAEKLPKLTTDIECATIGHVFAAQLDFAEASKWYDRAIKKAVGRYRGWHLLSLARLVFRQGDVDNGRATYVLAIECFCGTSHGDRQDALRAYRSWAWDEFEAGNYVNAMEQLDMADKVAASFPQEDIRADRLRWTHQIRMQMQTRESDKGRSNGVDFTFWSGGPECYSGFIDLRPRKLAQPISKDREMVVWRPARLRNSPIEELRPPRDGPNG